MERGPVQSRGFFGWMRAIPVREAARASLPRVCVLGAACVMALRLGADVMPGPVAVMLEALLVGAYWLSRLLIGNRPPTPKDWPQALRRLASMAVGRGASDTSAALRLLDVPMLLLLIAGASVGALWSDERAGLGVGLLEASIALSFLVELFRAGRSAMGVLPGAAALPLSFVGLIGACTLLLKLPACTYGGITWIDAAFTSTSAVCVTGLVVRDTSTGFTPAGQGVILAFIQLGALGIVMFGAGLAVLFRRTLSLREHASIRQMLERGTIGDLRRFIVFVLLATLAIEAIGVAALMPLWETAPGATLTLGERAWLSLFHTVSAFCNAGFDITGQSMVGQRNSALPYVGLIPLIVAGGIGFPVLSDLWSVLKRRLARARMSRERGLLTEVVPQSAAAGHGLSLHSKLTLLATGSMLGLGFAGCLVAQSLTRSAADRPWYGELLDAAFLSVTARTAGFNAMPMDELSPASQILTIGLMMIGGSPGSTAGGMKTTTLAVLFLSILATVRGRSETESFARAVPEALVRKAGAIALSMLLLVVGSSFCLALTDPGPLGPIVFEAVSAATTTGLSLGITPELSGAGRATLIVTMFLGRVGPLALMGALVFVRPPARAYLYPRESVHLG